MKTMFALIALTVTMLGFVPEDAMAQQKPVAMEALEHLMFFPTLEACKAAYTSGNFRYYLPDPKNLKAKPPANAKGLPSAYCVKEVVRESKAGTVMYVVLAEATPASFNDAGVPVMDGRCWNEILEAFALPRQRGERGEQGLQGMQGEKGDRGEKGEKGEKGDIGLSLADFLKEKAEPKEDNGSSMFGITASLGGFSSYPTGSLSEQLSGRSVCDLNGFSFDIGLAVRSNETRGSDFWRFTVAGMKMTEAMTKFYCPKCGVEATTVSENMSVLGIRGERVFRFTDWAVQPMLSVHAGVGRTAGQAVRYEAPVGKPATLIEEMKAGAVLGSDWFPMVGAEVGVAGDFNDKVTWTVTVGGLRYPGVYYAGASLTFWP